MSMSDLFSAKAIGASLVKLWAEWDGEKELQFDDAMKVLVVRAANVLDLDGPTSDPLAYFVRAYLHDENPEDLTYCEMMEKIDGTCKAQPTV